ncbi:hypothetical protein COBT_000526 [Conglomerata obtusa]
MYNCIDDIYNEKKIIYVPKYNFITEKFELLKHVFKKTPRIIIIEGLYAFNIFNARVFDISKFSVNDSLRQINNFFVDNVRKYENFIVKNIFLKIDQKDILKYRIRRDVKDRGKDSLTVNLQCEYQVIPNTDKYVNHIEFKSDVQIESGNHNDTKIQALINEILEFFELNKKRN